MFIFKSVQFGYSVTIVQNNKTVKKESFDFQIIIIPSIINISKWFKRHFFLELHFNTFFKLIIVKVYMLTIVIVILFFKLKY